MQEEMRMNKIALMPDPLQIVHRVESIDETEEGGEVEQEEVKPRRKYVPAQDKIQKELQEQSKREKGAYSNFIFSHNYKLMRITCYLMSYF